MEPSRLQAVESVAGFCCSSGLLGCGTHSQEAESHQPTDMGPQPEPVREHSGGAGIVVMVVMVEAGGAELPCCADIT